MVGHFDSILVNYTESPKLKQVEDGDFAPLFSFRQVPGGTLRDKTLFAGQGSDGMSMDAAGNVYLTADAVDV